jgi:hypothetical protein
MTSFNDTNIKKKEKVTSACPFSFDFISSVTLDYGCAEDDHGHDVCNSSFTTWSYNSLDWYGSVTFTVDFPSNNPAGVLTLEKWGSVIQSYNVPANTTQIYLLYDSNLCTATPYTVRFV